MSDALHEQRWFVGLILAYIAAACAAVRLQGLPVWSTIRLDYYLWLALVVAALGLGWRALRAFARRPAEPGRAIRADLAAWVRSEQVAGALPAVVLLPLFMSAYTSMLEAIPLLHPIDWDPDLARWDRLPFGDDPWRLLQPLLGSPLVTMALDWVYDAWFFVWMGLFLTLALGRDRRLRLQYFISFVLVWSLLGTVVATLFASGGPVYFGRITGLPDPFAPLMDYIHQTAAELPLWSTRLQASAWQLYVGQVRSAAGGISAMPSIHVAVAVLCVLTAWRIDRRLGAALTLFAVLVGIATVHLGWHYALDGYVGTLGTLAIWHGVDRCLARRAARPAAQRSRYARAEP